MDRPSEHSQLTFTLVYHNKCHTQIYPVLWDHRVGYDWFCLKQVGSGNKEKYIHLSEWWGPHSLSPETAPRVPFLSPTHNPAVQCKPGYNLHPNQNYFSGRTQILACFDLYSYEVLLLGPTSASITDKYLHRRVAKYPGFSKGLKHDLPMFHLDGGCDPLLLHDPPESWLLSLCLIPASPVAGILAHPCLTFPCRPPDPQITLLTCNPY